MSDTVRVVCRAGGDGWRCAVTVVDAGGRSDHEVTVRRADLDRYAPGATDPTLLVQRSFAFLLEREPKEAILGSFELPVIERYFPGYATAIRTVDRA